MQCQLLIFSCTVSAVNGQLYTLSCTVSVVKSELYTLICAVSAVPNPTVAVTCQIADSAVHLSYTIDLLGFAVSMMYIITEICPKPTDVLKYTLRYNLMRLVLHVLGKVLPN